MSKYVSFEKFYEATGRANAAWQGLEESLRDVFTRAVVCSLAGTAIPHSKSFPIMGGIFYASTNFRGTLQMISNVIDQTVTEPEIRAEWNAIKNRANGLYKRRNTLAHGLVWGNDAGAAMIMASPFNLNARRQLSYVQVCACEVSFKRTAERAHQLAIKINKHLAR